MANRLFGARQPKSQHTDSVRVAGGTKPSPDVDVVQTRLRRRDHLSTSEPDAVGADPYNSTGRFVAEKIKRSIPED